VHEWRFYGKRYWRFYGKRLIVSVVSPLLEPRRRAAPSCLGGAVGLGGRVGAAREVGLGGRSWRWVGGGNGAAILCACGCRGFSFGHVGLQKMMGQMGTGLWVSKKDRGWRRGMGMRFGEVGTKELGVGGKVGEVGTKELGVGGKVGEVGTKEVGAGEGPNGSRLVLGWWRPRSWAAVFCWQQRLVAVSRPGKTDFPEGS